MIEYSGPISLFATTDLSLCTSEIFCFFFLSVLMLKLKKMIDLVFDLTLLYLFGVSGAVTVKPVMVGESVTLEIQRDGDIEWKFRPHNILIAQIGSNKITLHENVLNGSFRGRLTLDQNGSLTINNTRTTDSGDYEVINTTTEMLLDTFRLTVYAPLPIPVISTFLTPYPNTTSVSSCVLMCSVVNVSAASLSWYKGNIVLSSIRVADLTSVSLPLEVEYQDNSSYSCVVNNPISNQTTHLDINTHCQTCKENIREGPPGSQVVLISAAAAAVAAAVGSLLIISAVFCEKHRKTDQEGKCNLLL
ncbi:CD48 antigen-like [Danio aesculapii]|uniref:CD48 antigen-like n=1 Tax=Danio aesculapii TaxID=1142201 RepID=UPI0024BF6BF1|nr:CD48 antigen-like [Danio aesculapii]